MMSFSPVPISLRALLPAVASLPDDCGRSSRQARANRAGAVEIANAGPTQLSGPAYNKDRAWALFDLH
jgi:hypothetical protein